MPILKIDTYNRYNSPPSTHCKCEAFAKTYLMQLIMDYFWGNFEFSLSRSDCI